jgi:indole-3-glycerol phosphate synthase
MRTPDPSRLTRADRDFAGALAGARPRVRLIAEMKRASPSAGLLTDDYDPEALASLYTEGGAAAISVLTDVDFFQGALDHLSAASRAATVPILRKDFVIDERQVHEARAAGAHSVLLIAALLDRKTLARFLSEARALAMEPLVEVHDEAELERALEAGARVVGINNRDLRTFRVDVETTFRLASRLPAGTLVVSESGVESERDIARLSGVVDAALVGTALMTARDRKGTLARLVSATGGS